MDKFEPKFLYLELELPPITKKDIKEEEECNSIVIEIFDSDEITIGECYNGVQIS